VQRYAVIVDGYHVPYGDNRAFASSFRARGVRPVTVMSTPRPLEKFVRKATWFPQDYDAVHFYDGNFSKLLDLVRSYDPVCIVAGNERGVELTAELVEVLMPQFGNVPGSAVAQRDKGEMVRALERHSVPVPVTISTADPQVAADWIRDNGLTHRALIVKPPKSAGTDNVHLVEADGDWRRYFDAILGTQNGFDITNDSVIVQEYLEGPEYIVDLYSVNGQHGLVDVLVYSKHSRGARIGIYDTADFLPPDHPDARALFDYVADAATAVGIRNGSTHAEVIMTSAGPRLVELAARYSGSCMMLSGLLATGDNQIERTVRHALDGTFEPWFRLDREVRTAWLCSDHAGPVRNMHVLAAIADLTTVSALSIPPDGKSMPVTNDVTTSLGWVIQGADSWAEIEADYRQIRELEREWNRAQDSTAVAAAP
jgi:biotin carboxylase